MAIEKNNWTHCTRCEENYKYSEITGIIITKIKMKKGYIDKK